MVILGVIMLVLGLVLGIGLLTTLGAILLVVGLLLVVVRPGGRVWY